MPIHFRTDFQCKTGPLALRIESLLRTRRAPLAFIRIEEDFPAFAFAFFALAEDAARTFRAPARSVFVRIPAFLFLDVACVFNAFSSLLPFRAIVSHCDFRDIVRHRQISTFKTFRSLKFKCREVMLPSKLWLRRWLVNKSLRLSAPLGLGHRTQTESTHDS